MFLVLLPPALTNSGTLSSRHSFVVLALQLGEASHGGLPSLVTVLPMALFASGGFGTATVLLFVDDEALGVSLGVAIDTARKVFWLPISLFSRPNF